LSFGLIVLANIVLENGDPERAATLYKESLALQKDARNKRDIADCLERLAILAVREQHFNKAVNLLGAAMGLREEIGSRLSPTELARLQTNLDAMHAALDEEEFVAAWTGGREMSLEQAVAYAIETKLVPSPVE
jgi:hypothetical protein